MTKVPLTSNENPPPDRSPVVRHPQRREQNRSWCVHATFTLCLLMIVGLFVLVLLQRPTEALVAVALSDAGLMASWQLVIRHYFPPPRQDPLRHRGRTGPTGTHDDSAAA